MRVTVTSGHAFTYLTFPTAPDSVLVAALTRAHAKCIKWQPCQWFLAGRHDQAAVEALLGMTTATPATAATANPAIPNEAILGALAAQGRKIREDIDAKRAHTHLAFARTRNECAEGDKAALALKELRRERDAVQALITAHMAGTLPPTLAGVRSRAKVRALLDARQGDLLALLPPPDAEEEREAALNAQIRNLVACTNTRDYFPTPPAVVAEITDALDLAPGMRVLEPSAGDGAILRGLRERYPEIAVIAVELGVELCDILRLQGFAPICEDFLNFTCPRVDRVIMNPPFGDKGDTAIDHVLHAFDLLKPGGWLVAILPPSLFTNTTRRCREFAEWVAHVNGQQHPLPARAFGATHRPTNTPTLFLMLVRPDDVDADEQLPTRRKERSK